MIIANDPRGLGARAEWLFASNNKLYVVSLCRFPGRNFGWKEKGTIATVFILHMSQTAMPGSLSVQKDKIDKCTSNIPK